MSPGRGRVRRLFNGIDLIRFCPEEDPVRRENGRAALFGLALAWIYSAPPLRLKKHGLGEPTVIVVWGPLMVGGVYYAATGSIPGAVIWASLPYAILCTTVLMGKHIDKAPWDGPAGTRTLPVILGDRVSRLVTRAMFVAFYLLTALLVVAGGFPVGTLLVFPSDKQIFSQISVYRRAMLAENGNSLFGLKFFPTAFVQYLRPDALRFRSLVPFGDFPDTAHVFGNVRFDTIEPTSSVTTTMPLFFIVAVIGLLAACWPDRGREWNLRSIRIPLLGALLGGYTVIPYSYIGQRYESDFVPILVIAGLCGLWMVVRWCGGHTVRIRVVTALAVLLAIWSVAVNTSLAWTYHNASDLLPEGTSAPFIFDQYAYHSAFPGGRAPYVGS